MQKMTSDEIRKVQLDLLLFLKEICEKYHLRYYLSAGTLLGAVRHKGFIPWDDDIDVRMPRPDYEKLLRIGQKKLKGSFRRIESWKTGESPYPFIKVLDTRTVVKEQYMDQSYSISVWIDVFPIDGMPDSDRALKRTCRILKIYETIFNAAISETGKGTTLFRKVVKDVIVPVCRRLDLRRLCARIDRISSKYKVDDSKYVGQLLWGYGVSEKLPRECLEPVRMTFEGHEFPVHSCWDYYLTSIYGDYMQLPPVEKRVNHGFDAWWTE